MKKDLHIFIDSVIKDKEKRTILIQGWGINSKSKQPLIPIVKMLSTVEDSDVQTKLRKDVNAIYELQDDTQCGFFITVKVRRFFGPLRIDFSDGIDSKRISFNLKRSFHTANEYGSIFSNVFGKMRRGISYMQRNGLKNTLKKIKETKNNITLYEQWIQENEQDDPKIIKKEIEEFALKPKISIVMPVYNVDEIWLSKCIDSVKNQYYENWELCMADDCSPKPHVRPLLEKYAAEDNRIKVTFREKNGHICEATNSALSLATGDYVGLLDNDDELAPFALYEVVKCINDNPTVDLIYSDEDKIDANGKRMDAVFKSDWSPDILMGTNYICHFGVYRRSIIEEIGGFRKGYEGAQDYDLVLRFTEKTDQIMHVPRILYHWRMLETSTAVNQDSKDYAFEAGRKAVQDALNRRGIKGSVSHGPGLGLYEADYEVMKEDMVSVIIPTRDGYEDLKKCIDSIVQKTTYANYEIIIADNGSRDERVLALFEQYKNELKEKLTVFPIDIPFNYSKINNEAVKIAKGKYLLFLNNDTEVIAPDWMRKMVSYAQFDRIGAVGAKLCYADNTIQHAGVIMGLGGVAGHSHLNYPRNDFGYFGRLAINCDYSAVTAACMMVKRSDFDAVGGFNEELTVAFNDVDLCLKLLQLHKNNVYLHQVELYHYESKSRGLEDTIEKQARLNQESSYMYQHWKNYIDNDPYYNPNLTRKRWDYSPEIKS